jgi:hypothetical protein
MLDSAPVLHSHVPLVVGPEQTAGDAERLDEATNIKRPDDVVRRTPAREPEAERAHGDPSISQVEPLRKYLPMIEKKV